MSIEQEIVRDVKTPISFLGRPDLQLKARRAAEASGMRIGDWYARVIDAECVRLGLA